LSSEITDFIVPCVTSCLPHPTLSHGLLVFFTESAEGVGGDSGVLVPHRDNPLAVFIEALVEFYWVGVSAGCSAHRADYIVGAFSDLVAVGTGATGDVTTLELSEAGGADLVTAHQS
jgi:hypothetical protein